MSTQYDTIQVPYDHIRKRAIALIEHENVQTTIAPFIKNAHVLELACGTGCYTYELLKWGASGVVGVDISPAMIEEARRQGSAVADSGSGAMSGTVDFIIADCTKPTAYAGGPFDLVFGAWLLNYAPNRAGLVDMFRNIALNLKDGGHFVAVTPPPTPDPTASINAMIQARPAHKQLGNLFYRIIKEVEDGAYLNSHDDTDVGDVDFNWYYLRKDVYEAAAVEGGLTGELKWAVTSVPESFLRDNEELESYQTVPQYGLLVVAK